MKDHIVNKKELKKRLEAIGWPHATGRSIVPTLDELVLELDRMNERSPARRYIYTFVMIDQQGEHYTRNIIVPYIEPAVAQGLMAEYHMAKAESYIIESMPRPSSSDATLHGLLMAKRVAIKDMLKNGIDTTPFDI